MSNRRANDESAAAYPHRWGEYISSLDDLGVSIHGGLSRFSTRYRLASGFQGLKVDGFAGATLNSYDVVIKIALSYSAIEALEVAIKTFNVKGVERQPIYCAPVFDLLQAGKFVKLKRQLVLSTQKDHLQKELEQYLDLVAGDSSDGNLRKFVEPIRHAAFHGSFNPTGAGLTAASGELKALLHLPSAILEAADKEFEHWLAVHNQPQRL